MVEKLLEMSLVDQLYELKSGLENELKVLGYSDNTIEMYMREIQYFINFCVRYDGEIDFTEINRPIILEALEYREKQSRDGKVSNSTKEVFIKALKRLFMYVEENIDPEKNYMRMFRKIKIKKAEKEKDYLNDDEIEKLLNAIENGKKTASYVRFRNALLMKLMLFGGLRISEVLKLRFDDFEPANGGSVYKIRVEGKGGKEMSVFVNRDLIEDELNELLKSRMNKDGYIFVTKNGRLMTRWEARSVADGYYRKAGINKHGLHILRHTLAMKLVREGVDLVHIKRMLRHSNIATTTVYAKSTEESLVDIANRIAKVRKE